MVGNHIFKMEKSSRHRPNLVTRVDSTSDGPTDILAAWHAGSDNTACVVALPPPPKGKQHSLNQISSQTPMADILQNSKG